MLRLYECFLEVKLIDFKCLLVGLLCLTEAHIFNKHLIRGCISKFHALKLMCSHFTFFLKKIQFYCQLTLITIFSSPSIFTQTFTRLRTSSFSAVNRRFTLVASPSTPTFQANAFFGRFAVSVL